MKRPVRFIALLFLLACGLTSKASYYDFTDETDLDYEKFVDLVEYQSLNSIEDTLGALKEAYPLYFQHYILMYKSRSLQDGSPMSPRAILFDRSSKFVFSFNGDPSQRGYSRIEIMQFRDETARFEFREVIFEEGKPPSFSEANPRKCMVCHQSSQRVSPDPRPNWEPYNTWPGAYGSLSGDLDVGNHDRSEMKKRGAHPSVVVDAELEQERSDRFFEEVQPEHPRYKYLSAESFDEHMTTKFTQFTGNLNARRITRLIVDEMPDVYSYLQMPYLALLRCGKLAVGETHLRWSINELNRMNIQVPRLSSRQPKSKHDLRLKAIANLHRKDWEYTEKELEEELKRVTERNDKLFRNSPTVEISDGLVALFEPLGISTADWSMDFQTQGSLAFRERFGMPSNTRQTLRDGFIVWKGREALNPEKMNCDEISDRATSDMERFRQTELYTQLLEA
ncbi:MAG: hypothetical protein AAF202_09650, partial [Pseudomonadota bacterium]